PGTVCFCRSAGSPTACHGRWARAIAGIPSRRASRSCRRPARGGTRDPPGRRPGAGAGGAPRPSGAPAAAGTVPAAAPNPLTGLRLRHLIVIDPGHGGADRGNPGRYFPDGLVEKDITLAVARLLRAELVRRGIGALLTRSAD